MRARACTHKHSRIHILTIIIEEGVQIRRIGVIECSNELLRHVTALGCSPAALPHLLRAPYHCLSGRAGCG